MSSIRCCKAFTFLAILLVGATAQSQAEDTNADAATARPMTTVAMLAAKNPGETRQIAMLRPEEPRDAAPVFVASSSAPSFGLASGSDLGSGRGTHSVKEWVLVLLGVFLIGAISQRRSHSLVD